MIRWAAVVVAMLVLIVAGCSSSPNGGYTSKSIFPADVNSVAVPIFSNDTFYRNVEFELTDALIKEIERRTPYKVTGSDSAHTILVGQIRSVHLDQLSKSRLTGLSEEVIVSVTIDFQWKDLRGGKVLVQRHGFSGHGLFVPSRPIGEPIELGQFAAVEQLARDVVAEMRSDW